MPTIKICPCDHIHASSDCPQCHPIPSNMPPTEIPTIAELHALSDAITNEMLRLYQSGMSLTEVADAFQTTAGTVRNRIKDLPDYNPRPRGNQKTS